jgi:LysM repeat protein
MLTKNPFILLLIIPALFVSCRASRQLTNTTGSSGSNISAVSTGNAETDYINRYKDIAMNEMNRTGIPASITLAQGMIESDYGRSELASRANNHFGIKCHNWNGPSVYHNDDRRNDCFRKYNNPDESFRDHSDFLTTGSRYSFLFDLPAEDYKGWARGLKKAGYATNPDYANMLIRKIEAENLTIYDKGFTRPVKSVQTTDNSRQVVSTSQPAASTGSEVLVYRTSRIMENNRIEYVIVKEGDTRESLEKEFKLLRWELPRYNDLENDFEVIPGQTLYLQPKRDKADVGNETYTTREGDSMLIVAQKYGIKLKSLYEMNRLDPGSEPAPGTKLWLRSMKPVY